VLTAQDTAGEKRRQHHHYLKGSIFCPHHRPARAGFGKRRGMRGSGRS
jgi:hypothetical protein